MIENLTNCNTSTLEVYTPSTEKPWNKKRVQHLYRRLGFGATQGMIDAALTQTPSSLIDSIITEAINRPVTEDPGWGYLNRDEIEEKYGGDYIGESRNELTYLFFDDLRSSSLRSRLVMFWSNHFVTEENLIKKPPYLYQQHIMRQTHAIGNFKDFVAAVGIDKSMLLYLNGYDNEAGSPNENYARELYELFTLGVDNGYTEQDIQETARALTGYNSLESTWGEIVFNEKDTFDNTEKIIFEETGIWGYDDVIRILFEKKAPLIASFICEKMYKYFVSPDVNETIVAALAQTFLDNDFEIAPVLSQLFKSEHFFDDYSIGTIIKSPIDIVLILQKELEMDLTSVDEDELSNRARIFLFYLDYFVFDPPNVAGWTGDTTWLNSVSIPERWLRLNNVLVNQRNTDDTIFQNFPLKLYDYSEDDAVMITKELVNHFLSKELVHTEEYDEAISVFKDGIPENYFTDGTWNLAYPEITSQTCSLLQYIIKIPEFQLK